MGPNPLTHMIPAPPACPPQPRGGLRDKPGKPPDYYHSCYCLSGLASSQRHSGLALGGPDNLLARCGGGLGGRRGAGPQLLVESQQLACGTLPHAMHLLLTVLQG